MLYDNILATIGNTPIVRLNKLAPEGQNIYVKVESFNPMASVKDRLAFAIIDDAEKRGVLKVRPNRSRSYLGQYWDCISNGLRC